MKKDKALLTGISNSAWGIKEVSLIDLYFTHKDDNIVHFNGTISYIKTGVTNREVNSTFSGYTNTSHGIVIIKDTDLINRLASGLVVEEFLKSVTSFV